MTTASVTGERQHTPCTSEQDDSPSESICQSSLPKFEPWNTHGGDEEQLLPSCPLTSTQVDEINILNINVYVYKISLH